LTDRLQDARDKLADGKSYLEGEIQSELEFEEIIGQSGAARGSEECAGVAPTDSTVLLLGEPCTAKELAARSVRSLSSRRDKTLIKLNCAAVPTGLLEGELFGHEKGAFTGAVSQKVGRIELAGKGGCCSRTRLENCRSNCSQSCLRVPQDPEFERLGGVHTLHVDVRIISATNRDLHQNIADKKFREDLFYRLNVFPIDLPFLR
jgi:formate hydrogenlyase transcriptional activator